MNAELITASRAAATASHMIVFRSGAANFATLRAHSREGCRDSVDATATVYASATAQIPITYRSKPRRYTWGAAGPTKAGSARAAVRYPKQAWQANRIRDTTPRRIRFLAYAARTANATQPNNAQTSKAVRALLRSTPSDH